MSSLFAIYKSICVSISAFVKEILQGKLTGAIHRSNMKCENSRKDGAKFKSYFNMKQECSSVIQVIAKTPIIYLIQSYTGQNMRPNRSLVYGYCASETGLSGWRVNPFPPPPPLKVSTNPE